MSIRVAAAFLAVLACETAAATDTVVVGVQAIAFDANVPDGTTKSVDWLHQDERHRLVGLGATRQEFADARLDIARVMGTLNLSPANSLTGTLEGGSGDTGAENYTFTRATAEMTRVVTPSLRFTGGGQYVEAGAARTTLLRAETVWNPSAALFLRAHVSESIGGNLPTRLASVRADYVRRVQVYGGVSVGRGAQSPIEFGNFRYERFTGGFVGVAVPLSRCVVGASWDRLALDHMTRSTATLTLAVVMP